MLASASVSLTTVRLLAPHLTVENHESLLAAPKADKREVEELVALVFRDPGSPAQIRKLPAATAIVRTRPTALRGPGPRVACKRDASHTVWVLGTGSTLQAGSPPDP